MVIPCGKHQKTSPGKSEVESPREEKKGMPQKQLETGHLMGNKLIGFYWKEAERKAPVRVY